MESTVTPNRERQARIDADMEAYYGRNVPSEAEMDAMIVHHAYETVRDGKFYRTLNDWIQVNDQLESVSRLRAKETPVTILNGAERELRQTMDLLGYDPQCLLAPNAWVEKHGEAAGRREGKNWHAIVAGNYEKNPHLKPITDVRQVPFDEIVDYRVARKERLTPDDVELINTKICGEWEQLAKNMHKNADGHDKQSLFERVYRTGLTRTDVLPEETISGQDYRNKLISRHTYTMLGDEYQDYYHQQVSTYAKERLDDIRMNECGMPDLIRQGVDAYMVEKPYNDRALTFMQSQHEHAGKQALRRRAEILFDDMNQQEAHDGFDDYSM